MSRPDWNPRVPPIVSLAGLIDEMTSGELGDTGYSVLHDEELIVLAVSGPNPRTDFHCNPSDELLIQVVGTATIVVMDGKVRHELALRSGESVVIPAGMPHYPDRPEGSLGFVVERRRSADEHEEFRWYCAACGEIRREQVVRTRQVNTDDFAENLRETQQEVAERACERCGR